MKFIFDMEKSFSKIKGVPSHPSQFISIFESVLNVITKSTKAKPFCNCFFMPLASLLLKYIKQKGPPLLISNIHILWCTS